MINVQYKCKLLGHKLKMCASVLCWHNSANAGIQVCFSIFMLSNRDWHEKLGDFLLTRPWHENQVKQCSNESIDFPHIESNLREENTFHKQASFMYHQVIASARSAVLRKQDYSFQFKLFSHEEKSTVQVLHAKRPNCKTKVLFHGTELLISFQLFRSLSEFLFCKSVKTETEGHCLWYFCVSKGYFLTLT